jgi:hypothetical protein
VSVQARGIRSFPDAVNSHVKGVAQNNKMMLLRVSQSVKVARRRRVERVPNRGSNPSKRKGAVSAIHPGPGLSGFPK